MSTEPLWSIFLNAAIVNNFVLALFLGICPFLGVSSKLRTASCMGAATLFVMLICALCAWAINLALAWLGLESLRLIAFITVIASTVQLVEMVIRRFSPALFESLGIFLPLITVNCVIMAGSLFMVERDYNFSESVVYGLGSGISWAIAIALLAGIREKLKYSDIPEGLRGLGITFITIGLMSLGFMSFSGVQL